MKRKSLLLSLALIATTAVVPLARQQAVEQWGMYEVALQGPSTGNPFVDVTFAARFTSAGITKDVPGFYDGGGTFRVRFMPERAGEWQYRTSSNVAALDGRTGTVRVTAAAAGNHGPVRVAHTFHFAYADGTPYKQVGTTAYAWTNQPLPLEEQTLKTLAASPFNKLRFCVFPKRYTWNMNEPPRYPFEGTPPAKWETTRFNPAFFQHLERRIRDLQALGIEADVILLHPYDDGHWGFDRMSAADDDRYLRYVVARLSAFRNVWWSLANEYDFMDRKVESDWERIGRLVSTADPYGHLLSIHNGRLIYNQTAPWITHASIQNGSAVEDAGRAVIYRDVYRKPIVFDEAKYEGDIPKRWGNLTAEEMVFRFWQGTVAGTYVGHGETYLSPDDVLWWSKGGVLKGGSAPRLAFLRRVLEAGPAEGIEPIDKWQHPEYGGRAPDYYLVYLGREAPAAWPFRIPNPPQRTGQPPVDQMAFRVEVLDTWNMTVTPVEATFTLRRVDDYFYGDAQGRSVPLPGKPYQAIRIIRTAR